MLNKRPAKVYSVLNNPAEKFARPEGVDEMLKEQNQIEWIRRMNNIKDRAEEIVIKEILLNM